MAENIKVTISPDELHAGQAVTIHVEIPADLGKIGRVVAAVPDYDLAETVPHVAGNIYRLDYQVPWEAWSGQYQVKVYVQDDHWKQLASTLVDVKVV